MTRTISRTRLLRGTQTTKTRDVVPGDAVAPRRRRLSGAGPSQPNRPTDPAELANRPLARAGDPDDAPKPPAVPARSRSLADQRPEAPSPKRRSRSHTAAIGALEPAGSGLAASLENTTVRGPVTGGPAARERSKLSRIRDGRYGRSRSRFIV